MLIGIDPGHGGSDPGAVSPVRFELTDQLDTKEDDITLEISKKLQILLQAAGLDTYMTRVIDIYEDLLTRSSCINNMKCDLAVSIHINSNADANPKYMSTYIQTTGGEAERLATAVQTQLVATTGWPDGGVKVANLHMNRETNMPSILVECGFISNPGDERQLVDSNVQRKIAVAITNGILNYIGIQKEVKLMPEQWKQEIIAEAKKEGLITTDHEPDDPATKWFVLAICLNMLKIVRRLIGGK